MCDQELGPRLINCAWNGFIASIAMPALTTFSHTVYISSMTLVLLRRLNHRNIELHHDTKAETVGVRIRGGEYRYLTWLGFIERDRAKRIGTPVKLRIARVGHQGDFGTDWTDVEEGRHILGCRTDKGVYAVVEQGVRVV